jgi:hypothetical protein
LGLSAANLSLQDMTQILDKTLGTSGTRLCIVKQIIELEKTIKVYTTETLCSAGEVDGSPRKCTYTLGAVWGTLEETLGKRLQGKHTESVLRGGEYDVFEFVELK